AVIPNAGSPKCGFNTMTRELEKAPLQQRFDHLLSVISGQRFLQKRGIGNEVPFFICPFRPEEAVDMQRLIGQLANRLEQMGLRLVEVNLYDLTIEILQARGIWQQVLEMEASVPKDQFKELLQGVLDPEAHLVPAIAGKLSAQEFD